MVTMHDFLLSDQEWKEDHVQLIAKAKVEVDSLPKTAATFKFKDIVDPGLLGTAREPLKMFTGAWEVPDVYDLSSQKGELYVNPHYVHAHRYTDCYTRCKCGIIQTHPQPKDTQVDPPLENANCHGDCKPYHRMETRAELMRQRERALRRGLRGGIEREKLAKRIGLQSNSLSHICQRLGIDIEEYREEYNEKRGQTMVKLAEQGYATTTIADIYGLSRGHVSKQIRQYGRSLREIREAQA